MIRRYTLEKMGKIWDEENKFRKWLEVEIAVCEVYAGMKKIPQKVLLNIKNKANFNIARIDEIEKIVNHDVIAFLTNVSEYVGPDSRYVHMGLTSSDILDTSMALLLREAADILIVDLKNFAAILKKLARKYKKTVMIGRSHGIHAEPITFGLKLALWYTEILRDIERMNRAREIISFGKLSGAVGTFSNIDPIIEEKACRILKLRPAPVSSQIIQRDRYAEYMSVLAVISTTVEKIAVEIRHMQRTEVLELSEPFGKGQKGSSAMPHKKNPILSERLTGMARIIRGNLVPVLENNALWHERDISHSSVERVVFPDSTILLDYMLVKAADMLENIVVYPENMIKNLNRTRGLIFSQRAMLSLVDKGFTREEAYKIIQRNALLVWDKDTDFRTLLLNDTEINKNLTEQDIDKIFDLNYYLRNIEKIFKRVGI
ncbi:adenylosuccinate lyase [Candidatus Desantisbacteria bacterium]|nr:adenylosuccinate lyase [Candidatus Desantisbacteria bacterium]